MRAFLAPVALLLLGTAALAGCAEEAAPARARPSGFEDLDIQAAAGTGAITGVVVDEALRPVASATVTVTGADGNRSAPRATDAAGRFAFDGLAPGIYIVEASSPLHKAALATQEVQAGVVGEPMRIVLPARFGQSPFVLQIRQDGYFDCSQGSGIGLYSSSNCVTDPCRAVLGAAACQNSPTQPLDNLTTQQREWHMDVGPGWQGIVIEMTWEPAAQGTSNSLGLIVSTYKPERLGTHSFANVASGNPLRIELKVNETHETASGDDPTMIPWKGMEDVSYFASARPDEGATCVAARCIPPAVAVQQKFQVFIHQFYYGPVPEGWSFVGGDPLPY